MTEHPFVPGAKVAMRLGNRWGASEWQSYEVEKLFKTGRFTLKDRDGQWNACPPSQNDFGEKYWRAHRAGTSRYNDGEVIIWNEDTDQMIREGFLELQREQRLKTLQRRFERLKYTEVTHTALDAIEAALADSPAVRTLEGE